MSAAGDHAPAGEDPSGALVTASDAGDLVTGEAAGGRVAASDAGSLVAASGSAPGGPRAAVTLRLAMLEDMPLRQAWLADPAFMSYNRGWAIPVDTYDPATGCFHESLESLRRWYTGWACAESRGYYLAVDGVGEPVGHAHFRLESAPGADAGASPADAAGAPASGLVEAHIGVNVVPARRGQGLGVLVLGALVDVLRADGRADLVVNEFEVARAAAVRTHERVGFVRGARAGTAPDGSAIHRWELPLR